MLAVVLFATASADPGDGKALYAAKCLACHGAEGRGDGPAARALPKKPRDFTSPEFWAATTDQQVRSTISEGLPGTIMRGFPMTEPQLSDLLAYLRTFAPAPGAGRGAGAARP